jgi:hypothetical protein
MAPQAGETLADLINAVVDSGSRGYEDIAKASIDRDTGYQPSKSMVWRVAHKEGVKINPALVRALTLGLGLPPERVQAAAHRQFIGPYTAYDPGLGGGGQDDEVIRTVRKDGSTSADSRGVEDFVRRSRAEDDPQQG